MEKLPQLVIERSYSTSTVDGNIRNSEEVTKNSLKSKIGIEAELKVFFVVVCLILLLYFLNCFSNCREFLTNRTILNIL